MMFAMALFRYGGLSLPINPTPPHSLAQRRFGWMNAECQHSPTPSPTRAFRTPAALTPQRRTIVLP